jgi:tetratricopeptide (TPR) repeat protein
MRAALEALRGGSARIAAIRAQVDQLLGRQARARRVPPILILGETGTGKGLLAHVREAERIARQLGDARRRAIAANWLSAKHWDMGELSEARGWAEVTLALANSLADEPLRGMGHYNVGRALLAAGQYRRAIESFRSGTDATGDYRAYARAWTCWALAGLGEFEEAFAEGRRGVEMAMRPPVLVQMCQSLGRGLLVKGDVETAVPVLGRGLAVAEEYDLTLLLHLARWPVSCSAT